jgi:hypothetical protein
MCDYIGGTMDHYMKVGGVDGYIALKKKGSGVATRSSDRKKD